MGALEGSPFPLRSDAPHSALPPYTSIILSTASKTRKLARPYVKSEKTCGQILSRFHVGTRKKTHFLTGLLLFLIETHRKGQTTTCDQNGTRVRKSAHARKIRSRTGEDNTLFRLTACIHHVIYRALLQPDSSRYLERYRTDPTNRTLRWRHAVSA